MSRTGQIASSEADRTGLALGLISAAVLCFEIVALVRAHGAYNGRLYDLDNVDIHVGDGRNYLERSSRRYDLIVLPLVYAEVADLVGYALRENYLFTRQAFAAI